ncbi:hypothetical protein [Streptosporangium pseudovulgare]|uniref:Uncharacterized protein n=1 Tax=Streptosporangium pseudovulgare TaxID=35765 RepID=A0ABQ2RK65_9ACTN|nr:hypothetical protein [Streptosporangium pseudovulgare]GGQ32149.1 hypothetical protein GCM10010140_72810 [Streptosporangium pseudovulgare]
MRAKLTIALASVLTAGTLAGATAAHARPAADAPLPLTAPYAQAAAVVAADGSVPRSKGVTSIVRTGPGRYTITLPSDINAEESVPQVTLNQSADWKSEIYAKVVNASTITVLTAANGAAKDEPFYFLLP